MNKIYPVIWFAGALLLFACNGQDGNKDRKIINYGQYKEPIIRAQRYLVEEDHERINGYIKRRGWEMKETGDGMYYQIYHFGTGQKALAGKIVSLSYHIELLDGKKLYSSDSLGLMKFRLGSGHEVPGMEKAVELLREGDKARFIFPPHLGYGLVGDGRKIPPRSVLVYKLELVDVSDI